jgi:hypothetical protein
MWENDRAQYAAEMITCAVFISGRILRQIKTIYEGEKVPHIDAKRARRNSRWPGKIAFFLRELRIPVV